MPRKTNITEPVCNYQTKNFPVRLHKQLKWIAIQLGVTLEEAIARVLDAGLERLALTDTEQSKATLESVGCPTCRGYRVVPNADETDVVPCPDCPHP